MTLIEWLRKLGILRYGAEGGVYRSAKDRPLSFQADDIFDSKKDAVALGKNTTKKPDGAGNH